MIRRIVTALILVPLAIIVIGFAVANRQSVVVSFDFHHHFHRLATDGAVFDVLLRRAAARIDVELERLAAVRTLD